MITALTNHVSGEPVVPRADPIVSGPRTTIDHEQEDMP
jgi:hypothetical protein